MAEAKQKVQNRADSTTPCCWDTRSVADFRLIYPPLVIWLGGFPEPGNECSCPLFQKNSIRFQGLPHRFQFQFRKFLPPA